MRVVYAYTRLYPEAVAALAPHAPEMAETPERDREAYYRLLTRLWRAGRTFVLIEQDIVVRPDTIDALAACPQEWCGAVYYIGASYGAAHGCTKYAGSFIRRHPDVPERVASRDWLALDTHWFNVLIARGERIHEHWPAVGHLHRFANVGTYNCDRCGEEVPRELIERYGPTADCPHCGVMVDKR